MILKTGIFYNYNFDNFEGKIICLSLLARVFVLFFIFRDRVPLCIPGCPGAQSVDQAGLEFGAATSRLVTTFELLLRYFWLIIQLAKQKLVKDVFFGHLKIINKEGDL